MNKQDKLDLDDKLETINVLSTAYQRVVSADKNRQSIAGEKLNNTLLQKIEKIVESI